MFNFLRKTENAFGLDISGSSFKLMQLQKDRSQMALRACANIPIPKGLMVNEAISDSKSFVYLLKKVLEKPQIGRVSTNRAVVSLPESKAFVRVIQIPRMSEAEADNAVPFEAENFIPLPIDQVYLDWQKLNDVGEKMNVLIIASPKEFVDRYLEIIDQAGVETVGLEVESQSCLKALVPAASSETVLIVDLDAYRSSLIMVEQGNLQFTSTIPIAGNSFTESIANAFGVSAEKAEQIKKEVGISEISDYADIQAVLLPVLNNLSGEIKNILKFHAEHSQEQVSRIILVGGSAKLKNLPEFLAPQLREFENLKVELGNPWVNVNLNIRAPFTALEALSFATSIGLALRGAAL